MIPVSATFHDAITAAERRVLGRVTIDYTSLIHDDSVVVMANESVNAAFLPQVTDNVHEPHSRWAAADGHSFPDGTWFAAPSVPGEGQMGWWGTQIAGVGGVFVAPFPTITINVFLRPIHNLLVVGDSRRGEFPVDFEFRLLRAGGVVAHTRTVTGNTLITWQEAISPVAGITQLVLEVRRWSHAARTVKILEVITLIQATYEGDDIISLSLLEERELAYGGLPVGNISANEISLKLNNADRRFDAGNRDSALFGLLRPNRRIRAWLGAGMPIEWVPLGMFWSGEWQAAREKIYAQTTGRDRLEMLAKSTYSTSRVFTNVSLRTLATTILIDAGLGAADYWVDPALDSIIVPHAWFGAISHRAALRQIAEASLGQVYCDRNGVIRVEGADHLLGQETYVAPFMTSAQSTTITADSYFQKNTPVRWGELANVIEVETSPLRAAALQEVFRSNEPIPIAAGQTMRQTVFYNHTPVIEAAASLVGAPVGTSITAATFHAWGADVSVHSPIAGAFTLVINGRPLQVQGRERVVVEDEVSIQDNGRLRYRFPDNHLVQSRIQAQTIANILLRLYRHPRRDLTMDWRGNPVVALGSMVITPDHAQWLRYWVIRQTLDFDGGLRANLEGRLVR
ncbi:MAG: hypothetical protein DDT19_01621 [Syntrophomonadaceae bacterium]|nr:hypothetical protein [Bacillota bacterium]